MAEGPWPTWLLSLVKPTPLRFTMGVPRFPGDPGQKQATAPSAFWHPRSQPGPPHESQHEIDWAGHSSPPTVSVPITRFLLDVWGQVNAAIDITQGQPEALQLLPEESFSPVD